MNAKLNITDLLREISLLGIFITKMESISGCTILHTQWLFQNELLKRSVRLILIIDDQRIQRWRPTSL